MKSKNDRFLKTNSTPQRYRVERNGTFSGLNLLRSMGAARKAVITDQFVTFGTDAVMGGNIVTLEIHPVTIIDHHRIVKHPVIFEPCEQAPHASWQNGPNYH